MCFLFVQKNLDSSQSNFLFEHLLQLVSEESYYDERLEFTSGGVTDYSLFGDGVGYYGYTARENGRWAIVDQEFQEHLAESGYMGFTMLVIILTMSIFRCYRQRVMTIECSIVLFYIIAMIGASVLSNHHQYNYMFWFALGKIWTDQNNTPQKQFCNNYE